MWANHGAVANRLSAVRSSVAEVRERTVRSTGAAEAVAEQRDSAMPFAEDDCVSSFGCWTDEDWADGVIVVEASQQPDPKWLTAMISCLARLSQFRQHPLKHESWSKSRRFLSLGSAHSWPSL
jgi:hypothetical protein